jgi:TIR domain
MSVLKIFLSHSTKYGELAKRLKLSLQALEAETLLDIKISEEMAGASNWRQWIEDNVRSADVFLLLYPHASMDMGWCNYELGRFLDKGRHIVCIKNTDIHKPPPAFEPYQAYDANEKGFAKFIEELFVLGTFTNGSPLNAAVKELGSEFYKRANDAKTQLAKQFAEASVLEHFYEMRLVISICYDSAGKFDAEQSIVKGNPEGLRLLGLHDIARVSWSRVRQSLGQTAEWPAELERSIPSLAIGSLPPPLPPFRVSSEIYIPVITRAKSVDKIVRQLAVIFVATDVERPRPRLFPDSMPGGLKSLLDVANMIFRARWQILEPRFREAKFRALSTERCSEVARSVIADYDQMQLDAEKQRMRGLESFYAIFDRGLRPEVSAAGDEWMQLTALMRATPPDNPEELGRQLKGLLKNNSKWLTVVGKQFLLTVAEFDEIYGTDESPSQKR